MCGLASKSTKTFSSIIIDTCTCISQNTCICMNSDLYFLNSFIQQTFNYVTMITVLKKKLQKKEKEHHKF